MLSILKILSLKENYSNATAIGSVLNSEKYMIIILSAIVFVTIICVLYMLSLNRLVKIIRMKDDKVQIHKFWIWTQIIPYWGILAFFVFSIKISKAIKNLNIKLNISDLLIITLMFVLIKFIFWIFVDINISDNLLALLSISQIVVFIIYWIRIIFISNRIKKLL